MRRRQFMLMLSTSITGPMARASTAVELSIGGTASLLFVRPRVLVGALHTAESISLSTSLEASRFQEAPSTCISASESSSLQLRILRHRKVFESVTEWHSLQILGRQNRTKTTTPLHSALRRAGCVVKLTVNGDPGQRRQTKHPPALCERASNHLHKLWHNSWRTSPIERVRRLILST